jgi:hypothetical protein
VAGKFCMQLPSSTNTFPNSCSEPATLPAVPCLRKLASSSVMRIVVVCCLYLHSTALRANDMWTNTIGMDLDPQVRYARVCTLHTFSSTHERHSFAHMACKSSPSDPVHLCTFLLQAGSNSAIEAQIYAPTFGSSKRSEKQQLAQQLVKACKYCWD